MRHLHSKPVWSKFFTIEYVKMTQPPGILAHKFYLVRRCVNDSMPFHGVNYIDIFLCLFYDRPESSERHRFVPTIVQLFPFRSSSLSFCAAWSLNQEEPKTQHNFVYIGVGAILGSSCSICWRERNKSRVEDDRDLLSRFEAISSYFVFRGHIYGEEFWVPGMVKKIR